MNNRQLGTYGEEIACEFLTARGYEIIEKNFWSRYGEIDLIARDGEMLSFVEVKLARKGASVLPLEQLTYRKRKHLEQVAKYYLLTQKSSVDCRFDIVAISGLQPEEREIKVIKNAFQISK